MNTEILRVLVADDEVVIADTLTMILKRVGFNARAVYSGEEALECCLAFAPDLFLSDVIMAGIDGIETAIRMRALMPGLRVLLFSGEARTADRLERARWQGYEFEVLTKPVHPKDILAKLRDASLQETQGHAGEPIHGPVSSVRATG